MASGSSYSSKPNNNKIKNKSPGSEIDPQREDAICVHVDPSNFRDVVQRLTGAGTGSKLPTAIFPCPFNEKHNSVDVGPARPSFKLQERRQDTRNLEIHQNGVMHGESVFAPRKRVMNASPVSTLDTFLARGSPRTPVSPLVQGEMAIANKGFYLHPSPRASSSKAEPHLLPLFPTSANKPQLLPLFPTSSRFLN